MTTLQNIAEDLRPGTVLKNCTIEKRKTQKTADSLKMI